MLCTDRQRQIPHSSSSLGGKPSVQPVIFLRAALHEQGVVGGCLLQQYLVPRSPSAFGSAAACWRRALNRLLHLLFNRSLKCKPAHPYNSDLRRILSSSLGGLALPRRSAARTESNLKNRINQKKMRRCHVRG